MYAQSYESHTLYAQPRARSSTPSACALRERGNTPVGHSIAPPPAGFRFAPSLLFCTSSTLFEKVELLSYLFFASQSQRVQLVRIGDRVIRPSGSTAPPAARLDRYFLWNPAFFVSNRGASDGCLVENYLMYQRIDNFKTKLAILQFPP